MKLSVAISLVCLVLLFLLVNQHRTINSLKQHFAIVNDSLTIVKDKHNREVATSKILQLEKKDLKKIAADYKSKFELEKIKPGKVVYIQTTSTQTKKDSIIKTIVTYKDSLPTYTVTDSSQWHYIHVVANADSSHVYWHVNNQFVSMHTQTQPFWKTPEYIVTTTNLNPNTTTTEQHTYKLKPKKSNRLLWFGAGFILSLITFL